MNIVFIGFIVLALIIATFCAPAIAMKVMKIILQCSGDNAEDILCGYIFGYIFAALLIVSLIMCWWLLVSHVLTT